MSIKEKYIAALNDEQAKMVSYVKQMTAKVAFPETAVTTTYVKLLNTLLFRRLV